MHNTDNVTFEDLDEDLEGELQAQDDAEAEAADSSPPPEIDPLEALMATATAESKLSIEAKGARQRLARGGLSATERAEDEERIRRWEAAHEWKAEAHCIVMDRITCQACGNTHLVFSAFMQRDSHRHQRTGIRWLPATRETEALPRETYIRAKAVPCCASCFLESGWHTLNAKEWPR